MKTLMLGTILFSMLILSTNTYGKKVIEDYSTSKAGKTDMCYSKKVSISVAKSDAKNKLTKHCRDYGWSSALEVTYGQTADCRACGNGNYKCEIIAKGWCYKYE